MPLIVFSAPSPGLCPTPALPSWFLKGSRKGRGGFEYVNQLVIASPFTGEAGESRVGGAAQAAPMTGGCLYSGSTRWPGFMMPSGSIMALILRTSIR